MHDKMKVSPVTGAIVGAVSVLSVAGGMVAADIVWSLAGLIVTDPGVVSFIGTTVTLISNSLFSTIGEALTEILKKEIKTVFP